MGRRATTQQAASRVYKLLIATELDLQRFCVLFLVLLDYMSVGGSRKKKNTEVGHTLPSADLF